MNRGIFIGGGVVVLAGAAFLLLPRPEAAAPAPSTSEARPAFAPAARASAPGRDSRTASAENSAPTLAGEFAEICRLAGGKRTRKLDELLADWTARAPVATAQFVLTIPDEDLRKECLLRVMRAWADVEPRAALAWVRGAAFANDREREIANCMACTQVAQADPEQALCLAADFDLENRTDGLIEGLTTRWAGDDLAAARRFVAEVDSSAVMVNASTRFNDGGQLGLGAEIGISTDKFHARGPCGLRELTSTKWIVFGDGHIRE